MRHDSWFARRRGLLLVLAVSMIEAVIQPISFHGFGHALVAITIAAALGALIDTTL